MKQAVKILICPFIFSIILFSCNPVKKVLNDESKMREVWNKGALDGWCVNDSVFTTNTDTLYSSDTLYGIDYVTDTSYVNGETVITKKVTTNKVINHYKTVKINTHTVVKDKSQEQLFKGQIEGLTNDLKLTKAQRNMWIFRTFLAISIGLILLFRKPLLNLASGGVTKGLGFVKKLF